MSGFGPIVPWAHSSPQPKVHLDRFSRFAGLTIVTDRRTDRETDRDTPTVTIGRIYARCAAMLPNNNVRMPLELLSVLRLKVVHATLIFQAVSYRIWAVGPER